MKYERQGDGTLCYGILERIDYFFEEGFDENDKGVFVLLEGIQDYLLWTEMQNTMESMRLKQKQARAWMKEMQQYEQKRLEPKD
tara:strand:+ start:284 stop:535 length:252 start_codon:yes stop_codon:yes gene_type:complete